MAVERMNTQDLLQVLPEGSLLADCEAEQLDDLLAHTHVEFVPKREMLIHQGDFRFDRIGARQNPHRRLQCSLGNRRPRRLTPPH